MKHWRTILWIFIGLTITGIFLPLIVTQLSFGFDVGRSDANEIGDTIGGILGPYFSFIGSVLLAYTIYLQIEQRKDDETKYAVEKLRLETESKTSNKRQFEKMIFESCMESLTKVERKIHELNIITPDMIRNNISIQVFTDTKSEAEKLNREVKSKQVYNEFIDSMSLFNENKIIEKAYQRIFINKIDNIFSIIHDKELIAWNKKTRVDFHMPYFFHHDSLYWYENVKEIYSKTHDLKSNYQNNFDNNFQKDEIEQLKETLDWLSSFEVDLKNYFKLKNELPIAFDFDDGPILNDDNRESYEKVKAQMAMIEEKYGLND